MTQTDLNRHSSARLLHSAVTAPTAVPSSATNQLVSPADEITSYISGTGNGTVLLWIHDGDNTWHKGDSYDFETAKLPQAVVWDIPARRRFTFQVSAISGGNVTVKVL